MGVLTEKQLSHVRFGIHNDIPIKVNKLFSGNYKTIFPGNLEYLQEVCSASSKKQRLCDIANSLTETLYHSAKSTIDSAETSAAVKTGKQFCTKFSKQLFREPCVDRLKRQLLATRLGIPVEAFDANPGFHEFASKNFLYHYLKHYGHKLQVAPSTYELKILSEGQWRIWADVKNSLSTPLNIPKSQPKQPWIYGYHGVQSQDMYHWKTLAPYKFDDSKQWGGRWVLEICACNESSPRKTGDHSWFRLKTPTGEIYSIGLYRPVKSGIFDNLKEPLRIKKGHLMQPDLSEFYPCSIHAIQYEINEEIFLKIKAQVEEDKRKDEELFQAIGINCTQYVNKIAGIAGIHLPTKKRIWRFLSPPPLGKIVDAIAPYIPECVKKICDIVAAVFLNILQVILGATKNDPMVVNGGNKPVPPYITSFWDLFDPDKASLHHPHTLGWEVYLSINRWRCQERKKLKQKIEKLEKMLAIRNKESAKQKIAAIKKRIEDIAFDIPPEYKAT